VNPGKREEAIRIITEALIYFRSIQAAGYAGAIDEFDFRLVLDEAMENAIIHGNRLDPGNCISIELA
jgi:anti-sigma regulatory factor (Ser/Thr protein kinase)